MLTVPRENGKKKKERVGGGNGKKQKERRRKREGGGRKGERAVSLHFCEDGVKEKMSGLKRQEHRLAEQHKGLKIRCKIKMTLSEISGGQIWWSEI